MISRTGDNRRRHGQEGFTLIEIMVVVVILGLLATIVAQNVFGETDRARLTRVKADLTTIKDACGRYRIHHQGRYPEDLTELVQVEDGSERYLEMDEVPKDPWGTEYRMERQGGRVVIISDGPDGQPDSEDDITTENMRSMTVEKLRQLQENQ